MKNIFKCLVVMFVKYMQGMFKKINCIYYMVYLEILRMHFKIGLKEEQNVKFHMPISLSKKYCFIDFIVYICMIYKKSYPIYFSIFFSFCSISGT